MMCFAEIEDASSSIELVVFPEVYRAASHLLSQGQLVCVEGKVSGREDEKPKIIAEHIISADSFVQSCLSRDLCIRADSRDADLMQRIKDYARTVSSTAATNRLIIYFADLKRKTAIKETPFITLDAKTLKGFAKIAGEDNTAFMEKK
jgi:DNA polymerase-3 subunit alpha